MAETVPTHERQVTCPVCKHVQFSLLSDASGLVRVRCHNRACREWFNVQLDDVRVVVLSAYMDNSPPDI